MTTRMQSDSPKVTPPRVHGVVDRERLFARIDAAIPPVIWIAGSPGAGKTTQLLPQPSRERLVSALSAPIEF